MRSYGCHIPFWLPLGPPVVPSFYPSLGEGSPTKIDYRKKGTLILTSLLEDLVPVSVESESSAIRLRSRSPFPLPGAIPRLFHASPGGAPRNVDRFSPVGRFLGCPLRGEWTSHQHLEATKESIVADCRASLELN